ncbi:MAG: amidohydrolase family protein [Deltaproteobacteria bacterium]|uniref:Amidohydrolase family protein n=1 Tax=Candidatus Zymogenus saltonus TaxID=2844893 RepID=A0A9D8PQT2_9DELT|nr:amidohydrolase family protein [Candidatus Zymogenus saltonus]
MKDIFTNLLKGLVGRRGFLKLIGKTALSASALSLFGPKRPEAQARVFPSGSSEVLLKNGLIVDGTGKKGFLGNLLIRGNKIADVTGEDVKTSGAVIDCTGKVISPGIIDAHSHMDWYLPIEGHPEVKTTFTGQGVTTFVAGNCGYGIAGFRKDSTTMDKVRFIDKGLFKLEWNTMEEYFSHLKKMGLTHNLVNLAGHGTTRASMRGFDASPLNKGEMTEILSHLELAMDQGAYGVSFGLQYEPGIFATLDEIGEIAKLIKKKDKILTVHMKAYSSLSGTYPLKLFGTPHNLLGIEDMINVARETGVRMELSHLIFVGEKTWKTVDEALTMIDGAVSEGLDVKFDTYSYHCGTSIINVFFPEWFLAKVPGAYEDRKLMKKLKRQIFLMESLLGFGYKDIQITDAKCEELEEYNGMFLYDIAKKRNKPQFENFIDFARKSGGIARVLNHRYTNLEIVEELMRHPASLFMTDALPALDGVQNPGCSGCFPRFFQIARDNKVISLEEAIYKMSGASMERFNIKDRGILKAGLAADVLVFDEKGIVDNNTLTETDRAPSGIEAVFINGVQVLKDGAVDGSINAGVVVS